MRQAVGGESHPGARHLGLGDKDDGPIATRLEGDLKLIEALADASGLGRVETGIKQAGRLAGPGCYPAEQQEHGHRGDGHRPEFRKT